MTLDELGLLHKTDKASGHHDYLRYYEGYFGPARFKELTLLECGYGGYQHYDKGGESARMWLNYFPNAKIISTDLYAKRGIDDDRFRFYQGSQDNGTFFKELFQKEGTPDIIIDDASHVNALSIQSFKILWPYLNSGGIYVCEDLECSYWEEHYGGSKGECETTTMNFFKRLTDHLNYEINGLKDYGIEYIHFYRQIVFIKKK